MIAKGGAICLKRYAWPFPNKFAPTESVDDRLLKCFLKGNLNAIPF